MMEFEAITGSLVTEHFQNLSKAVKSLDDAARDRYADNFPIAIWTMAGMDEQNAFAISMN